MRSKKQTMNSKVIFRSLGPSDDDIKFAEANFLRYSKAQKKEFAKLRDIKPATAADVKNLQMLVGKLPDDYINFLETQNGGRPIPSICVSMSGVNYIVNEIFALVHD